MSNMRYERRAHLRGYSDLHSDVPPVFIPGDPLVILGEEPDDVFRCCLADAAGQPITCISDTLFVEEIEFR